MYNIVRYRPPSIHDPVCVALCILLLFLFIYIIQVAEFTRILRLAIALFLISRMYQTHSPHLVAS